MSWWGLAPLSFAGLVFLALPLVIAHARRSGGQMTRLSEHLWRSYERLDRRAAEGWTPPWWYPLVVGSTAAVWALMTWLLTHDVGQASGAAVLGIGATIMAVVVRRQAGGGKQHSRDR
jgi:Flp pilus assembly protein TadB